MSGTFSSFGSALSALRYNRVAMDVASNNVANAHTTGYTRRMAVAQATGAPAVQALWSTWNGTSGGVEVGGIERMVDPLLDARSRTEHSTLSYLDTRAASLVRFETTIGEPGDNGIAAALSAFKQGWHDVANSPGDEAARSQLVGRAQTLEAAIKSQAAAVGTEWSDQRVRLDSVVDEANKLAADLAELNGALITADNAGTDASTLLDQRDQLALRLAELTGAEVRPRKDSPAFDVVLNGASLVDGGTASMIRVEGGSLAGTPALQVFVDTATGPVEVATAPLRGQLGGIHGLLVDDLPDYLARLDAFTAELVAGVNDVHQQGFDLDGNAGGAFFDPAGATAATVSLSLTDPRKVAAADTAGTLDGSVAMRMASEELGGSTYRSLVTDFGVKVASARRLAENQGVLTAQVDASRESLSGVNIDEEMVNLLAAQRAYEGASRVITTLDSVLDTLINRTGLTR
jgi:flagellar hook-associated protein 1 FlgK